MRLCTARGTARLLAAVAWVALLSACGFVPERDRAAADPEAASCAGPKSRYGNPRSYVVFGQRYNTLSSARGFVERGIASWYGKKFHGRRTSSGVTYDMYKMTAAHKTLPLPTYVSVRNLSTGREIRVCVNDRGPFHGNRIIDLSYAAANQLGIARKGTGFVEVRAIGPGSAPARAAAVSARGGAAGAVEIFIQAGAFRVAANAERLRANLAAISSTPVRVLRVGDRLYRVRLGPLSGVEEADRLANALARFGYERPQIVAE